MAPFPVSRVIGHLHAHGHNIRFKAATVDDFLRKLKSSTVCVDADVFAVFLSGETGQQSLQRLSPGREPPRPCTAAQAALFLSYFPLSALAAAGPRPPYRSPGESRFVLSDADSAAVLLPLMRWGSSNPARLLIVESLLKDAGANPSACLPDHGPWGLTNFAEHTPPLHVAIARGDLEMVRLLVRFGADVTAQIYGFRGRSALLVAKRKGFERIAEVLEGAGAVLRDDDEGEGPNPRHPPEYRPGQPERPRVLAPKVTKRKGRVGSKAKTIPSKSPANKTVAKKEAVKTKAVKKGTAKKQAAKKETPSANQTKKEPAKRKAQ